MNKSGYGIVHIESWMNYRGYPLGTIIHYRFDSKSRKYILTKPGSNDSPSYISRLDLYLLVVPDCALIRLLM